MPANVEIKARLEDFEAFHTLFKKVYEPKDGACRTLEHCDTYFKCDKGRLKLREIKCRGDSSAEIIFYDRNDTSGPKRSNYVKHDCSENPESLKECLIRAYGKRGEVKKTRFLYIVEQTRVHIDKVTGIGQFMELEVMLRSGQTTEDGQKIADAFMEKLNITPDMLIQGSYIDFIDSDAAKTGNEVQKEEKHAENTKADVAMKEAGDAAAPKGDSGKTDPLAENGTTGAKTES